MGLSWCARNGGTPGEESSGAAVAASRPSDSGPLTDARYQEAVRTCANVETRPDGDGRDKKPCEARGTSFDALANTFHFCSHRRMTLDSIATAILSAPGWARVGLTMRDEQMRERAADTIAATILDRLEKIEMPVDRDQLAWPF